MMSRWVPAVSLIGLICVMVLPTPGVLGIAIGGCCVLAIVASATMVLAERFLATVLGPIAGTMRRWARPKKRYVHASSGIARKH